MYLTFWHKVIRYAEQRLLHKHMKKHGCTVKCPHCRQWWHVSNGRFRQHNAGSYVPKYLSNYDCGNCGQESFWNFGVAPVPLLECKDYNINWTQKD